MKLVSIQRSWLLSLSSPLQHSLPSSYVCMCMPTCFCMCMHLYIRYNLLLPFFSLTLFFLLLNWTWPLSIKGTRNFSFVAYIYTLVRRKEEKEQQWWLKKKKKNDAYACVFVYSMNVFSFFSIMRMQIYCSKPLTI